MDKLKMHSPDLSQDNIAKIRDLFPGCVTEARDESTGAVRLAVDFDQLRQELSDNIVDGPQERYRLDWPGKREALALANAPIAKTLRPVIAESENFDATQNLFIEGDNLEVLKLLQTTYLGKIKLIYIDPPYNTGSDLIYEDDFSKCGSEFLIKSNQSDAYGNKLVANSESNGRFHSDWLSMMYARLKIARNLLRDDGAIFISIANDEFHNLRKICDEVFGENNFVECITWNKRIPKNDKGVGNIHDFILVYVKNDDVRHEFYMRKDGLEEIDDLLASLRRRQVPIPDAEKEVKKLYRKQGYDRGITLYNSLDKDYRLWGKINMSWPNANTFGPRYEVLHPITREAVKIPDRGWRWKEDTFNAAAQRVNGQYVSVEELHDGSVRCGKIWFSKDSNQQPSSITYLDEVNQFLLRSILSFKSDGGMEVEGLFGGKSYFSYPKPTSLMRTLLSSKTVEDEDIILDFFAGSCSTAHAVMQMSSEDKIRRRFIMVQIPEEIDASTEAAKAGFKSIADIGKERIRLSAKKVRSEFPQAGDLDFGFRVLKLDSSNMKDVYYRPDKLEQSDLLDMVDNVKDDRTSEDLLFQVLVDWGVDLTLPIRRETVQNKTVFFVDDNVLAACFDRGVTEELVKELAKREPLRVVFRDNGFVSDAVKINVEQIFRQLSPSTDVKVI
ncbi:site-specific DNA-methyltransferase [Sphingopyxis granuli]|uniref:site-specific DNA-methyltransferase n=1 Tax=Sphingopyxis granuli TaxID=267128 RepID=UPI000832FBD7|nr:site-specific DNA-methyltransferase [Sphingopyxis granuli]